MGPNRCDTDLAGAIPDPIEAHVHGFAAPLLDCVIGDADGGTVVDLARGGELRMPEFFEGCSDGTGFFAVMEESGEFGFGGTGANFS